MRLSCLSLWTMGTVGAGEKSQVLSLSASQQEPRDVMLLPVDGPEAAPTTAAAPRKP